MTLSQLRTFALVARLGSLHAAAETPRRQRTGGFLGPGGAPAGPRRPALRARRRRHRADPRRPGTGRLRPGHRGPGGPGPLGGGPRQERRRAAEDRFDRAVCRTCGRPAAGPLHQARSRRLGGRGGGVRGGHRLAAAGARLRHRPRRPADGARRHRRTELGLECVPFLRYQRILVAAAGHPLAPLHGPVAVARLLGRPWFAGPAGIQASSRRAAGWRRWGWRRRSSG